MSSSLEEEDRVEEIVQVESQDMKRLSANNGARLQELREVSGCDIDVPKKESKAGKPVLDVRLFGPVSRVQLLRQALEGVLMGETPHDAFARADGASVLKNLDPASLRHLSEQQATLEALHKVSLRFEGRSVHVRSNSGDAEAASQAREALLDAIVELTEVVTESVVVPRSMVNPIMNHAVLCELRSRCGVTTTVSRDDKETVIRLSGLAGVVVEAKALVTMLASGGDADYIFLASGLLDQMDPAAASSLEADLSHLQHKSNTTVEIQWDSSRLYLCGDAVQVSAAKHELMQILCFYFAKDCAVIEVPPESIEFMAGRGGSELRRMPGIVANLDHRLSTFFLSGKESCIESARAHLRKKLQKWERRHAEQPDAEELADPTGPIK